MENLRVARVRKGLTQIDVANRLGISRSTYANYEVGSRDPDTATLGKIADLLNVTTDFLLGKDDVPQRVLNKRWVPLLGEIHAGELIQANENIVGYLEMPADAYPNDDLFALTVVGDSMSPIYLPGDNVIYRVSCKPENGDDVAVRVNGDEVTLKRFKLHEDGISFMSLNAAYTPSFYSSKEVETLPVEIIGVVVEMRRTKNGKHK